MNKHYLFTYYFNGKYYQTTKFGLTEGNELVLAHVPIFANEKECKIECWLSNFHFTRFIGRVQCFVEELTDEEVDDLKKEKKLLCLRKFGIQYKEQAKLLKELKRVTVTHNSIIKVSVIITFVTL